MTSVTKSPVTAPTEADVEHEINLALREIADQLLQINQDFTTLIPPIRREGENVYLINMAIPVNYFNLRSVVDDVLKKHRIRPDYRISLLNCETNEVSLGFLARATDIDKEVPCQSREQQNDCYNLRLALIDSNEPIAGDPPAQPMKRLQWLFLGLAISFPVLWMFWKRETPVDQPANTDDGWLGMTAQTRFHPANQTLQVGEDTLDLTFREAKLLQFFYDHQNQVLERERILESVWEDEGVIVGRSLDVFVSRLRKKLKADEAVQITNVHGVGYKLLLG
ncbi:transcriptional regulator [Flavilitoribacter nigricans DSM 23189 = NBRC 102662]|uniref:Transcriptional regulator n=2 Tax=Flavilitoribacter TaxID=2762562 RepID=A0A2D0N8T8_FLAN2|nr:transcriptional regulator [Flavilitoribacter nigricans DSM 23189 = NBRC 102662]